MEKWHLFQIKKLTQKNLSNLYIYYYSKNPTDIAYVSARELLNNKKSFRIVRCKNCNYYFMPKTSHKTLYCDDIYENNKTCKEYANSISSTKTYESDEICKKYGIRSKAKLQTWIKKYNSHEELKSSGTGGSFIMTKGRKTTFDERVEIVQYRLL